MPWFALVIASLVLLVLSLWAYRFVIPPLPARARRLLPALRGLALLVLLWLLAQPIVERLRGGAAVKLVILVDRSRSMELPMSAGDRTPRARAAAVAVEALERSWRGRASVQVLPFAGELGGDSGRVVAPGATALGTALAALPGTPAGGELGGVVVVSDGAVNAGEDPVAAARALGVPVHAVVVGDHPGHDRAVVEIETPQSARVGEPTPVRVHVISTEPAGTALGVRLLDGGRELAHGTVTSPGPGAEATLELRTAPTRPGLAVWSAVVDSLAGEPTIHNNARQAAIEVAPGRFGVLVVSGGLNWDLAFLRRAWLGDSSLALATLVRETSGWRSLERDRTAALPSAAALRGQAVVVLDGISPVELGPEFDRALTGFVRDGGGLLILPGPGPGITRIRGGALGAALQIPLDATLVGRPGNPEPTPEGRELLAWDDDPARGERAWRAAAPLSNVAPVRPGAGDRVLIASMGDGPPLLVARRIGRGQALSINGTGIWRWSLSGLDELAGERGRRLWRRVVHWLAEPVQGEPLRVRPERWLTPSGETVRLFASLQDTAFKPVAGATVEGEVRDPAGRSRRVTFTPRAAGSYVATFDDLPPGRFQVSARATRGGRELGRSQSEFAVDRWSLEEARPDPDSTTLAAVASATGGRITRVQDAGPWAHRLETRSLARGRTLSMRLWESPWLFALVIAALGTEWAWRRRRGLP